MNRQVSATATCLVALALVAGCGEPPTTVSGTVSLDAKPLAGATLEFVPVAGDGPTSAATTGADGRFRATVAATPLKVVIHASQRIGEIRIPGAADGATAEGRVEILPPRYSDRKRSELSVTPTHGTNTAADFSLVSEGA